MASNHPRAHDRAIPVLIGALAFAMTAGAIEGRADRISLRGGGQIRGKIVADPDQADRVTILTETGKTPLSFRKEQIIQVEPEPGPLDEYVGLRAKLAPTAEAEFELGLWCADHQLQDLAEVHYEGALGRDKDFAPAHEKLGHVRYRDGWLWGDELREAQGLVRYKGRWISKQEKERREELAATGAEQASWVRRLKLLRQALVNGPDDRRRDAETHLMEIRDPVAVSPLVQVFGRESEAVRTLLDRVLERIPGPEASSALVAHILHETDQDVRQVTISALTNRNDPEVVSRLTQALRSDHPSVVNRAAWSLGQLEAVRTVPKLIPALITIRYQVVMPPLSGGSGGGNFSASFGSIAPTGLGGGSYFGNVTSYGLLTPPAVGPGAVGFGATGVPYPPVPLPGSGFSTGGSVSGSRGSIPRLVPLTFQNVEVLSTLIKLTGQNFGFDINAWKRWVSSSFHPDPTPARSVPQP